MKTRSPNASNSNLWGWARKICSLLKTEALATIPCWSALGSSASWCYCHKTFLSSSPTQQQSKLVRLSMTNFSEMGLELTRAKSLLANIRLSLITCPRAIQKRIFWVHILNRVCKLDRLFHVTQHNDIQHYDTQDINKKTRHSAWHSSLIRVIMLLCSVSHLSPLCWLSWRKTVA